jgi:hypothetical protein
MNLVRGEEWHESEVFPRVILCDFSVRLLANNQRHTVQCVIMLNLINEKSVNFLYLFILILNLLFSIQALFFPPFLVLAGWRNDFGQLFLLFGCADVALAKDGIC